MGNNVLNRLIDLNEGARDCFLKEIEALKEFKNSKSIVKKIEAVIKFKQQETLGVYKFREFKDFVKDNIEEIVKKTGGNYLKRLTQEFMELQSKIDVLKQNITTKRKSVFVEKLNNAKETQQQIQTIHPNSLF